MVVLCGKSRITYLSFLTSHISYQPLEKNWWKTTWKRKR